MGFDRVKEIAEVLTEEDLAPARKILESISENYPNGFTFLSHLAKIPRNEDPEDFVYEFELSEPVKEFMIKVHAAYSDKDFASAICGRVLEKLAAP